MDGLKKILLMKQYNSTVIMTNDIQGAPPNGCVHKYDPYSALQIERENSITSNTGPRFNG
tara:strand:- start:2255 stop:2434 length:180 start_codon:yes stop_codon:yes gene_type:complete